jgi:hypothetical protein
MANIINGTDTGSGGLITTGDSSDELQLQTAEVARVTLTNTAVVVNESGADVDFRVESDNNANLLFVDASTDRIGIGTASPASIVEIIGTNPKLTINANDVINGRNATLSLISGTGADPSGTCQIMYGASNSTTAGTLTFVEGDGTTERARLDPSGNLLVGTTNTIIWNTTNTGVVIGGASAPAIQVSRSGDASLLLNRTSSDGNIAIFARQGVSVGNISVTASATAYNTSSDYRLKENIAPMTGALAKVLELNPVTYTWKADGSAGEGFIAHELQAVVPDAVTGEKDATEIQQVEVSPAVPATYDEEGNELTSAVEAVYEEREFPNYQGVDTSFLVATLTAAIQELKAELDEAKARIAALENA